MKNEDRIGNNVFIGPSEYQVTRHKGVRPPPVPWCHEAGRGGLVETEWMRVGAAPQRVAQGCFTSFDPL